MLSEARLGEDRLVDMHGRPPGSTETNEPEKSLTSREGRELRALPPLDTRDWPDELIGSAPHEILVRIVESDCFKLFRRCEEHLHSTFFLLDPQRLADRTAAVAAYRSARDGPTMALEAFLQKCVEESVRQLLAQDRERDAAQEPHEEVHPSLRDFLSGTLGIAPNKIGRAIVVFNSLPPRLREAFFLVVVDARNPRKASSNGNVDRKTLEANLEEALRAMALLEVPDECETGLGDV